MTETMLNKLRQFTTYLTFLVCLLPATLHAGGGDWNSPFYIDNGFNILHKGMVKTYIKRSSSLSPHNFNSEEYEERALTEQYNLAAWSEYLKTTPKVAKEIVYDFNPSEEISETNRSPAIEIAPSLKRYLTIVRQQEEVVSGGVPYWLSGEEKQQAIKQRQTSRNESINTITKQLKTETDAFLRQRYVYLLLRLQHYSGQYQAVVDLYQQHYQDIASPKEASNREVTHWINLLKAGALQRLGKRAESAYLFATTFRHTESKRLQAQINFKIKTDEEWDALLGLSENDDEKALMHFMRAIRTNANSLQELQAIYRIAPDSEWFDNLLIRELEFVQFARQRVFGGPAGGSKEVLNKQILIDAIGVVSGAKKSDQKVLTTQAQRRAEYIEQLSSFLSQVREDKKRKDLYLSDYASLYLKLLSSQSIGLSEVLDFQRQYAQDSRLTYSQGLDYFVYLENLKAIDESAEKIISKKIAAIEAINKDEDGKPLYNDDIMAYTYIKLEPMYFKTGQAGKYYIAKARGFVDEDEILIGEIKGLEALKKKPAPNLLEQRMLVAFSQRQEKDIHQMIARKYLSAGMLEEADQALKASDSQDTTTTHYNPFMTARPGNNRQIMTAADVTAIGPDFAKEKLTRTEVIGLLRTLQADLKKDPSNATLHFRLGTAYYNMTWFGNSPRLLRSYRSTSTWVNGEIDLSKARHSYENVLKYSKDRELNAKTLYALAKIEENELYIQQKQTKLWSWMRTDNYRSIVLANKKLGLGQNFELLAAFEDTQYFNDVIRQCADYRYYFDNR